jgi:hypothetical protein
MEKEKFMQYQILLKTTSKTVGKKTWQTKKFTKSDFKF